MTLAGAFCCAADDLALLLSVREVFFLCWAGGVLVGSHRSNEAAGYKGMHRHPTWATPTVADQ